MAFEQLPKKTIKPPDNFDSVVGVGHYDDDPSRENGCVVSTEYVCYDATRVVPRFLVTYKHCADCKCTRCS